jgi:hypothetical protein
MIGTVAIARIIIGISSAIVDDGSPTDRLPTEESP